MMNLQTDGGAPDGKPEAARLSGELPVAGG